VEKRIGVLTIHGMGRQRADFDRVLRERLSARLGDEVRRSVQFQSIFYQDEIQGQQNDVWARMVSRTMDWSGSDWSFSASARRSRRSAVVRGRPKRKNSANPHHRSGGARLKGMTVIDMGARVKQYCSDVTRTIFFGKPLQRELEAYHLVKGVQEQCCAMVKEGERFFVINHYAQQKLGKPFLHSIGHGLGIDVHEEPFVGKNDVLRGGMVVTIEPGVYYPGKFGIRIEDDVVVEKNKGRVLSRTGKELLVV